MKIISLILISTLACATCASAQKPNLSTGVETDEKPTLFFDAAEAAGIRYKEDENNRVILTDAERKKIEMILSEVEPLYQLNPDSLKELSALSGSDPKKASISAIVIQETILDYEAMAVSKSIPTLIAYYIAKNKSEGLRPHQRAILYVMLKSSMRKIRNEKASE